jgi:hypothetical protein
MKKKVIFMILVIFQLIAISGCLERENDNIEDINSDDNSNQNYQEMILGTWNKIETVENITYKTVYKFFSNYSFFSGIIYENMETYNVSIWGTYNIDNESIYFTINEEPSSEVANKYFIYEDEHIMLLYYEDEINFDILYKEI